MKRDIRMVIQRPIITERSTALKEAKNRYLFRVDPHANKREIKKAVEELFGVHVKQVTTAMYQGKPKVVMTKSGRFAGKAARWKKAYVTLAAGETIEVFDVV
jgi:large subunit ribosomal protein L23